MVACAPLSEAETYEKKNEIYMANRFCVKSNSKSPRYSVFFQDITLETHGRKKSELFLIFYFSVANTRDYFDMVYLKQKHFCQKPKNTTSLLKTNELKIKT